MYLDSNSYFAIKDRAYARLCFTSALPLTI